jgi:hypothetical protein
MDSQSSLMAVDSRETEEGRQAPLLLQQLVQPSFDALMLAFLSEILISVIALSNSDDSWYSAL